METTNQSCGTQLSQIQCLNRYRKVHMCLFDIYLRNDEYDKENN